LVNRPCKMKIAIVVLPVQLVAMFCYRGTESFTFSVPLWCVSLHRREAGGLQDLVFDARDDGAVLFSLGACADPFRIGLEGIPLLFAIGERFPLEEIVKSLA